MPDQPDLDASAEAIQRRVRDYFTPRCLCGGRLTFAGKPICPDCGRKYRSIGNDGDTHDFHGIDSGFPRCTWQIGGTLQMGLVAEDEWCCDHCLLILPVAPKWCPTLLAMALRYVCAADRSEDSHVRGVDPAWGRPVVRLFLQLNQSEFANDELRSLVRERLKKDDLRDYFDAWCDGKAGL